MEVSLLYSRDCGLHGRLKLLSRSSRSRAKILMYASYTCILVLILTSAPQKLIKEIVIWKDHEHPCLLKFFAGCLFDKPKFIVSPYCKNGNALDYLQIHPDGDRAKMVCQRDLIIGHLLSFDYSVT